MIKTYENTLRKMANWQNVECLLSMRLPISILTFIYVKNCPYTFKTCYFFAINPCDVKNNHDICKEIAHQNDNLTMKKTRFCLVTMLAVVAVFSLSFRNFNRPSDTRYAVYAMAFYNLENLFDTIHDVVMAEVDGQMVKVEDKNDYEYLPDGANKWGTMKYKAKLKNMSEALARLATDEESRVRLPMGPAIIGVSEIENRRVLEDLIAQPALKDRNLQIIHEEGPDRRGVECAFLYNPKLFKYKGHSLVPYIYPNNDQTHRTRGFLIAEGQIGGEDVYCIVCHWPSRMAVSFYREHAGVQVRAVKDSLLQVNPKAKIFIMGDMNDDPDDKSMAVSLGAKRTPRECKEHDLYNPWWDLLRRSGVGTLKYNGNWNLFDQIVFTGNLLNTEQPTSLTFYRTEVFNRNFLTQQEGKYKGYPKRTHAGGVWLNGYSDHYPVIIYLRKPVSQ